MRVRANDAVRDLLHYLTNRQLDDAQQTFDRLHPTLVENYLGQYVALLAGKVIDSDVDERILYIRVYQKKPNAIIGIVPVNKSNEPSVLDFTGFFRQF